MPPFETTPYPTSLQNPSQTDKAPPDITRREPEMTPTGPATNDSPNPNANNSSSLQPIGLYSDAILVQLWNLLQQLEEINIQFALLLEMLEILKSSTPLNNPSSDQMNQPDAPKEKMPNSIMTPYIPKLPPPAVIDTTSSLQEQCQEVVLLPAPTPMATLPDHPIMTIHFEPQHTTQLFANVNPNWAHDTHQHHDIMSMLTCIDTQCDKLEMMFAQFDNPTSLPKMITHNLLPDMSTPSKTPLSPMVDPTSHNIK